jgi:hypothetical protein
MTRRGCRREWTVSWDVVAQFSPVVGSVLPQHHMGIATLGSVTSSCSGNGVSVLSFASCRCGRVLHWCVITLTGLRPRSMSMYELTIQSSSRGRP